MPPKPQPKKGKPQQQSTQSTQDKSQLTQQQKSNGQKQQQSKTNTIPVIQYSSIPKDDAIAHTATFFDGLAAHKQFSSLGLKLSRDDVRGRYVTATKQFKPGTTILQAKPWSYALFDTVCQRVCDCCNQQFTKSSQPIQCSKCSITLWCSRKCFNESSTIHPHECNALSRLKDLEQFQGDKIFLKLIIRALIRRQLNLQYEKELELKIPIAKRNKALAPFKTTPEFNWDDLASLVSHNDKFSSSHITDITTVMNSLQKVVNEPWFDGEYIAYARHLYLLIMINKLPLKSNSSQQVGFGLYLSPSYFNHSCEPNCMLEYGSNGIISIRTLRQIEPNEELTHSYTQLYEPSYLRRSQLKRLYHFDTTIIPQTRTDPIIRVADDYHTHGLKCIQCDNGILNYHQIKHYLLPQQIQVITQSTTTTTTTPEESSKLESIHNDNVTTTTTTTPIETNPESSTTTITKPWLDITKPDDCTNVICYNCNAKYPLIAIDNWLKHIDSFFLTQRTILSTSREKYDIAQTNLLQLASYVTKPKDENKLSQDNFNTQLEYYSNPQYTNPTTTTIPTQLFRFNTSHLIIYMTYQSLLFLALQQQDILSVQRFSQFIYICLTNQSYNFATSDYHEVLMHLGDSCTFTAGHYNTITGHTGSRSHMIVSPTISKSQLEKAKEYYQQSLKYRQIHFGKENITHPYIVMIQDRLERLEKVLNPNTKSKK